MLGALVGAHVARIAVRNLLESYDAASAVRQALATGALTSPFYIIYWSAYIYPAALIFVVVSFPLGWAYWLGRPAVTNREHRWVWMTTTIVAVAAIIGARELPTSIYHPGLLLLSLVVVETLLAAMAFSSVTRSSDDDPTGDRSFRNLLSRWMTASLVAAGALAALAVVDTLGQTVYVLAWGGAFQQKTIGTVLAAIVSLVAGAQGLPKLLDTGQRTQRLTAGRHSRRARGAGGIPAL